MLTADDCTQFKCPQSKWRERISTKQRGKRETKRKKEKMPLTHANIRQIETKMLSGPMQIVRISLLQIESDEFLGRAEGVAVGWLLAVERLAL